MGKSQAAVELYKNFAEAIEELDDVIAAPAKTRVGFQVRMIFASVNRLNDDALPRMLSWRDGLSIRVSPK